MKIRIITDSTSNISQEEAKKMGIDVVPLNIFFDEGIYKDGIDLMPEEFYEKLLQSKNLPKTSQPSPSEFIKIYEDAKSENEIVIAILISSKLSGTYHFALSAKEMAGNENVYVIDSLTTIMGLRILVEEALELRNNGASVSEIVNHIETTKEKIRIFGVVDTLEYLHKGGRLSKTSAIIGNFLHVKPIIGLDEGEISLAGKARGTNRAIKEVLLYLKKHPVNLNRRVYFGYTGEKTKMEKLINEVSDIYSIAEPKDQLVGGVIGTHTGPNICVITYVEIN